METLKEEIEEATKMQVVVGPIDSRFIPSFMESSWRPEAKEST
jgi:CO dehydrogenase/acetyl-CoA synthase gamma subunit (corrinoid Fe-S protein)